MIRVAIGIVCICAIALSGMYILDAAIRGVVTCTQEKLVQCPEFLK